MSIPVLQSEEYITIDASFRAHYGVFNDGAAYLYPPKFWGDIKKWAVNPYIPTNLPLPKEGTDNGVDFACFEHVSVCISGSADFALEKTNGELGTYTYHWAFGAHNVDNGWGYLPRGYVLNNNYNNFQTCCVLQDDNGRDPSLPHTKFEVFSGDTSLTTSKLYKWIHIAYGSFDLNGTTHNQKQTVYDVAESSLLTFLGQTIVIAAYTE